MSISVCMYQLSQYTVFSYLVYGVLLDYVCIPALQIHLCQHSYYSIVLVTVLYQVSSAYCDMLYKYILVQCTAVLVYISRYEPELLCIPCTYHILIALYTYLTRLGISYVVYIYLCTVLLYYIYLCSVLLCIILSSISLYLVLLCIGLCSIVLLYTAISVLPSLLSISITVYYSHLSVCASYIVYTTLYLYLVLYICISVHQVSMYLSSYHQSVIQ